MEIKKHCATCKHCLHVEVAFDDEAFVCTNLATKLFDVPIGYISDKKEACALYEKLESVQKAERVPVAC